MPDLRPGADHAAHDLLVIAAGTDPHADAATRGAADRQAADCPDCAALAADLRSIASSLRTLPRTTPIPKGRDFRISRDQASRLRRWAGLRRLLRPFGAAGAPSLRPLATALTGLGVAGLLFAVALPNVASFGSAGSGAALTALQSQPADSSTERTNDKGTSPAPPLVYGPGPQASLAAGESPGSAYNDGQVSVGQSTAPPHVATPGVAPVPSPGTSPVAILSLGLLALGVLLFGLRVAANRLR